MHISREKREKVGLCYLGLGNRGMRVLTEHILKMRDIEVVSVCDLDGERLGKCGEIFKEAGRRIPHLTQSYLDAIDRPEVDAVVIMTGWDSHIAIALEAMRAGKYTAMEVGCAYELSECFALVDAYERYGAPLMMLENCCYGRRELMALNMVKQGLFGKVVHAEGGYRHDLMDRELVCKDGHYGYRTAEYLYRNCENYPTHELGPISKILGINRGNRFMTLASFASSSRRAGELCGKHGFRQGDIITTVITCAAGQTVRLTLDTTLPRPHYSRDFSIRGTKGCCIEEGDSGSYYLDGMDEGVALNEEAVSRQYEHPLQRENMASYDPSWHRDNIDWLVLRAFIEAVKAGTDTPIDAYDTAAWLAVGPLSEDSIARGGAVVQFPDFTRGKWLRREPPSGGKYSLDEIVRDDNIKIYGQLGEGYDKQKKA